MNIDDHALETPCLIVEAGKVQANAMRLRLRYADSEVTLRPHMKTVKCIEAAALALPSPEGPATVSTLREAEVFGQQGVTDLLYAVGIAPQKLGRVCSLRDSGIDLKIITDNTAAAEAICASARQHGGPLPTLIELDVDGHRSGIGPDDVENLLAVGRILESEDCLAGVMTHAGESYALADPNALADAAEQEWRRTVKAADTLRNAGFPCPIDSIGSTPTAFSATNYEGISEVRAGVYLFFDLCQAGIGVCNIDDIALSVLATVIGHQRRRHWTIVDAGWMALSSDRSTAGQAVDQYLGVVCDIQGTPIDDLVVLRANQEHGIIAVRPGSRRTMPDFPVGTRLRILPNHACATAAQHDAYQVVENGVQIAAVWPRFGGW